MSGYVKLFSSILTSTIWQEPKETKLLWITMLAMSNRDGVVEGSVPGLAKAAGITIDEAVESLKRLCDKDFWSRTQDHEGRRIEVVDGGWRLLNHGKYRALMSLDERREYNRRKQAEYRAKKAVSLTVNHNEQSVHIPDTREQIPETKIPLAAKPRARNELSDALARACGIDPMQMTARAAQSCAVAAALIRKVCPQVEYTEMMRRAGGYRAKFRDAALTPRALCDHWAECDGAGRPLGETSGSKFRSVPWQNPAPTDADHAKGF
jgi:hypothetical protein